MPTYKIKDPETGKTVKITGDSPPSEAELEEIFENLGDKPAEKNLAAKIFPSATAAEKNKTALGRVAGSALGVVTDVLSAPSRAVAAATSDQEFGDPGSYPGRETAETRVEGGPQKREEMLKPVPGNPAVTAQNMMIGGAIDQPEEIAKPIRELAIGTLTDPLTWLDAPLKAMLKTGEITGKGAAKLVEIIKNSGARGEALVEHATPAGREAIQRGAREGTDAIAGQAAGEIENTNYVAEANDAAENLRVMNERKSAAESEQGTRAIQKQDAITAHQDEAARVEADRQAALESGLTGAGVTKSQTSYARGQAIVDAAEAAKKGVGARVGNDLKSAVHDNNVGVTSISIKPPSDLPKFISEPPKNQVQNEVVNILKDIKYNPEVGELGSLGNTVVTESGIKALKRYYKKYNGLKTFDDAVLARQEIGQELFSKRLAEDGDRVTGSSKGDLMAAERLYKAINEKVLAPSFARAIPDKDLAAKALETWLTAKDSYSDLSKGIDRLRGNLENSKEKIIGSLDEFGVDNFKALMKIAETSPEVRSLVDEMKGGLTDAIIASSMKGDRLDYKAAKKAWGEIPPETKEMLFPESQRAAIDKAFTDYESVVVPEVPTRVLSGLKDKSPKVPPQRTPKVGSKIGKDAGTIAKRIERVADPEQRYALQELYLLDAIAGRTGPEGLAERARSASQAKMLGMDAAGNIPKFDATRLKGTTGGLAAGSALTALGVAMATGRPAAALAGVPGIAYSTLRASPYLEAQATRALVHYAAESPSKSLQNMAKAFSRARTASAQARVLDAIRKEVEAGSDQE